MIYFIQIEQLIRVQVNAGCSRLRPASQCPLVAEGVQKVGFRIAKRTFQGHRVVSNERRAMAVLRSADPAAEVAC